MKSKPFTLIYEVPAKTFCFKSRQMGVGSKENLITTKVVVPFEKQNIFNIVGNSKKVRKKFVSIFNVFNFNAKQQNVENAFL